VVVGVVLNAQLERERQRGVGGGRGREGEAAIGKKSRHEAACVKYMP
jgi:hypothetical protein